MVVDFDIDVCCGCFEFDMPRIGRISFWSIVSANFVLLCANNGNFLYRIKFYSYCVLLEFRMPYEYVLLNVAEKCMRTYFWTKFILIHENGKTVYKPCSNMQPNIFHFDELFLTRLYRVFIQLQEYYTKQTPRRLLFKHSSTLNLFFIITTLNPNWAPVRPIVKPN